MLWSHIAVFHKKPWWIFATIQKYLIFMNFSVYTFKNKFNKIYVSQHTHYSAKHVQIFVIIPQLLLPSNLYKELILWCCYTDLKKSFAASQKDFLLIIKIGKLFLLQLEHLFIDYPWSFMLLSVSTSLTG